MLSEVRAWQAREADRELALALSNKGTVGCLLCHSAIARQLAALEQGERAMAGSDEGTHYRRANLPKMVEERRPFRSLYI